MNVRRLNNVRNYAVGVICTLMPLETSHVVQTACKNEISLNKTNNISDFVSELKKRDKATKKMFMDTNELINRVQIRDSINRPRLSNPTLRMDVSKTRYRGNPQFLDNYLGGVLEGKGQQFYDAQEKYGINASFLIAIAKHESGNGTSDFARNRCNIAGMRNKNSYMYFSSVNECIDKMASNLKRLYIDQGLTTIPAINKKYAESTQWGNSVLNNMKDLYTGTQCKLYKY